MLPVEFKKTLCRPVEFKGQGPLSNPISGGVDGGSRCRMSIIRNGNVACRI